MDLVMIAAAQMWPVRDEKDATGTHITTTMLLVPGAQFLLVLTVAIIVLKSVQGVLIMKIIIK